MRSQETSSSSTSSTLRRRRSTRLISSLTELQGQRERVRTRVRSASRLYNYANLRNLWACGVGAVISGDFFGWNNALTAGFGGTLIFLVFVIIFYTLLTNAVAEMVTRIPQVGGAYTFALIGCGNFWGYMVGVAETIKLVSLTAGIVCSISDYAVTSDFWLYHLGIWIAFYGVIVAINAIGVKTTFCVQMGLTLASIFLLVIFYVGAFFVMDFSKYAVGDGWFVEGFSGVIEGVPFILWFFVGIEELPLTIEGVSDPLRSLPPAISGSMATLAALALLTVTLSCSVDPGTLTLESDSSPLYVGYEAVFGSTGLVIKVLSVCVITGLVCSMNSFVFFSAQMVYSMALDSLFPERFAQCHPKFDTPVFALVFTSCLGLMLQTFLILLFGLDGLIAVLLSIGLFFSVFSYIVQFCAFICLQDSTLCPDQPKEFYGSPFGKIGAWCGIIFGIFVQFCLVYLSTTKFEYAVGLVFCAISFVLSLAYYYFCLWHSSEEQELDSTLYTQRQEALIT